MALTKELILGDINSAASPEMYVEVIARVAPPLNASYCFDLAVSSELISVKITGAGSGQYPHIENYIYPDLAKGQLLLPFANKDNEGRLEILKEGLFASMALPGLFPPRVIKHCISKPNQEHQKCTQDRVQIATFIDGGSWPT